MFDFDDIETVDPAKAKAAARQAVQKAQPKYSVVEDSLRAGETKGPPAFAHRAEDDPLKTWCPLRHLVLRSEWVPHHPPGHAVIGPGPEAYQHSMRPVLCVGPPSAKAADWTSPDAFGSRGTEGAGNALALLAKRHHDEVFILQYSDEDVREGVDALAEKLASSFIGVLTERWVGVGVSVGCWLLCSIFKALSKLGDQGLKAYGCCEHLHMVGFPAPGTEGLKRPTGLEDVDWQLAQNFMAGDRCKGFAAPNELSVYWLLKDTAISRDAAFAWFSHQPSLQNGASKSAYKFFGVQGDHGMLRQPRARTELFWALGNNDWGLGSMPEGVTIPLTATDMVKAWWESSEQFGHGPSKPNGIFDEEGDVLLNELDETPGMMRFSNMHNFPPLHYCAEDYCAGNAGAEAGLDIRMYIDKNTKPGGWPDAHKDCKGCRTVSAVRFGNLAGISVFPGGAMGVHGGAIQAAMDETTALCMRAWVNPSSTTRKISHQISRAVYQYMTYKVTCEVESVKNDGAVYVIKGKMYDLVGDTVCITSSEMVDYERFQQLQWGVA